MPEIGWSFLDHGSSPAWRKTDMISALLGFTFRQRSTVILMGIGLAVAGIWAFQQLKLEAYPDISETQVIVITLLPGLAAEEIEQQVTIPIEKALQSVPKAVSHRSRTIFGLSVVDITFEYGTEDSFVRQSVLEKLRDVELPEGAVPTLAPPTTPAGELFRYVVESSTYDEAQRREIQDWVIAPRLLQVQGVGDVFAFGGLVKQYQIEVDPLALYRYKMTIRQIADTIGANNENTGGSLLSNGQQAMAVRGIGLIRSTADLEQVVVSSVNGVPVFVRDIGTVKIGAAPRTGIFGLDGRTGLVEGVVAMRRGDNPSEVLRGVREAVEELNQTLPKGVQVVPIYDRTELVSSTLHTVTVTLVEGLVIVVGVLLMFLGSVRAALLTAVTIPMSLLFSFLCMYLVGIPANLFSLGALDFGIIVDGTLVMVVHILRTLTDHQKEGHVENPMEAIREAVFEMERPVLVSLMVIISAYIPLFGLENVERRLFTPMAFTICFALIGSLLITTSLIPSLATCFFSKRCRFRKNRFLALSTPPYERVLGRLLRQPYLVVIVTTFLVLGGFWAGRQLGTEFLPQLDEGVIWIRATLPPGTAIEASAAAASQIRKLILQTPEVSLVSSQTGRQDSNTEPFGPNRNELLVALKPYGTWGRNRTKSMLVEEISLRLHKNLPGINFSFTQPIIDMVTEAVTGSSADLAVIFTGPELPILRRVSLEALDVVRQVRGAADSSIEQDADQPQLHIEIDRQEMARYGLNIADVQQVIELAIGGRAVSTMYEGDRRFDITVRYRPEARSDLSSIRDLLVMTPEGGQLPLAQLAKVSVIDGASVITRRENRRQISVRTNIRGRDQGSFVTEVQQRLAERISLPPGYRIEWGGQFENLARAGRRLTVILPLTVLLMLLLLFFAFESAIDAGLVLLNVPFSLIGGVLALLVRDIPLSVSAAVGFVSVFGVAIMTGILYIAEANRLRAQPDMTVQKASIAAAGARLAPNFLLILVALLGMIPAATATGIGSDIQRPMATVIVGGLCSTLILTLIAMPVLYYLVSRNRRPSKALLPIH
jgi:cobalt-zinc-cadmium resistance protein CzcA